jgi:hypothetical protein
MNIHFAGICYENMNGLAQYNSKSLLRRNVGFSKWDFLST